MVWTAGHTLRLVSWTLEALKFHAFFRASRKLFPLYMSVYAKNTNSMGIFQHTWSTAIFRKNEEGPYLTRICCQKWFNDDTMGPQIAVFVCVLWTSIRDLDFTYRTFSRHPNWSLKPFESFEIESLRILEESNSSHILSWADCSPAISCTYPLCVCVCVFSILKKYLSVSYVKPRNLWIPVFRMNYHGLQVCSSLNLTISPTRWRRYREGMELFSNELSWVFAVCSLYNLTNTMTKL